MEIVNNRYRIIKSLFQNQIVSSYLVSDLINKNQLVQLDIINSEFIPRENLKYYVEEFITLSNINNPNIVKLYEFGLLKSVDGKNINNTQYLLTKQYIETTCPFNSSILTLSNEELLKWFNLLCQTVNFIHLKGFVYGELNLNCILELSADDKFEFMLKDFISVNLEKINPCNGKDNEIIFKAPEVLSGMTPTIASDVYSLGIILLSVFNHLFRPLSFSKDAIKANLVLMNEDDEFSQKIYTLIVKMTNEAPSDRFKNIRSIIQQINSLFNTSYKAFNKNLLQKLNFDTKIVGRNYEVNRVLELYNSLEKKSLSKNLVLIAGQAGTGKTKLLKEISRILSFKNANVYFSFHSNAHNENFHPVIDILRKMVSECDLELFHKYEGDLIKLIPDLGRHRDTVASIFSWSEKEKFTMLTKIFNFMYEFIQNKRCIFLIDNIHLWDEWSIKLIEYLHIKTIDNSNALFILSFKSSCNIKNETRFLDFLNKVMDAKETFTLHLNGLNRQENALLIQYILGFSINETSFSDKIYQQTSGNPLFVQEIIKNLYITNAIFINENTGTWNSEEIDRFPIPESIEQAAQNQIEGIGSTNLKILKVISVFYNPIPSNIISSFINKEKLSIDEYVQQLISIGILCTKIDDSGFLLDFSNIMLKNLVYSRIDDLEKKWFHKMVVELLENQEYNQQLAEEDIIYHLEQAGLKEKLVEYCVKESEEMQELKNTSLALKNLLKAVATFSIESSCETKLKLLMKIGEIYFKDGKYEDAIYYYEQVAELTDSSIRIDAINELISIYIIKNSLDKVEAYFSSSLLLENQDYERGYLKSVYLIATYYWVKLDYKKSLEIGINALSKASDGFPIEKANIYRIAGTAYSSLNRHKEALEFYNKALELLEGAKPTSDLLRIYNCIAVIYLDWYQDTKLAMDYYHKINNISKKHGYIQTEILATTNLSNAYYLKHENEAAFEYGKSALEMSLNIGYESIVFYNCCIMIRICIALTRFSEAKYYLGLASKEIGSFPSQSDYIYLYYTGLAHYYYILGASDQASQYCEKIISINEAVDSTDYHDIEIMYEWCNFHKSCSYENISIVVEKILKIIDKFHLPSERIFYMLNTIIRLEDENNPKSKIVINKIIRNIQKLDSSDLPIVVSAKFKYCIAKYSSEVDKITYLTDAFTTSKKQSDIILGFRIACTLGNYYYSEKNYFHSINYYFEACEIAKSLVAKIPEQFKLIFILNYKILNPFIKLDLFKKGIVIKNNLNTSTYYKNLTNEDIEKLLDYNKYKDIILNKDYLSSAKKVFKKASNSRVNNVKDLIENLSTDPIKNIELALSYLSSITFASYGSVIVENEAGEYTVFSSTVKTKTMNYKMNIIDKVKRLKEPILFNNTLLKDDKIKAVICIPISMDLNALNPSNISKLNNNEFINIVGYLYLESDRILNNFNKHILKKCINISKLIGSSMEKYNYKVSSSIDKLTGAFTRKYLEQIIVDNIHRCNIYNESFSLLMFDVDHFKIVNDEFGHQVGDEVLAKICRVVIENLKGKACCGRYGGEEFIVILPSTKVNDAFMIAEDIRGKIENETYISNKTITVSIGVVSYPEHGQWKQDLIEKVDQALYVAKRSGRNKTITWNNSFTSNVEMIDKHLGIISGNPTQDTENLLVLAELINLLKDEEKEAEKLNMFLNKIIEVTGAEAGSIMAVENNFITKTYCRKTYRESKDEIKNCNFSNNPLINSVINSKKGTCIIDWDDVIGYDALTGIPSWNSILVSPIIIEGIIKGIIYLTCQTKQKEFTDKEISFVNTVSPLLGVLL